ncbi:MAG TPA: hypothetical protein PLH12_09250 [Pseudomonadales bacterium]|nr:hypothetical protein [Pseudomonadales bacterium]
MFKIIGILVAAYAAYCVLRGEVFIKSGAWGKSISRDESPTEFWLYVTVYAGLAIALMTVF